MDSFRPLGEDSHPWTLRELLRVFDTLVKLLTRLFKLCLFIDGLDGFERSYENLIELIKRAVAEPNVKVCPSSRPWSVFEDAFPLGLSLMLQRLTYPNIVRFVTERLRSIRGIRGLQQREATYASDLVQKIATKSSGVFLGGPCCQSLFTGLSIRDQLSDLDRRLEEIPADLEKLYVKTFDIIDPFYAEHASELSKPP